MEHRLQDPIDRSKALVTISHASGLTFHLATQTLNALPTPDHCLLHLVPSTVDLDEANQSPLLRLRGDGALGQTIRLKSRENYFQSWDQ